MKSVCFTGHRSLIPTPELKQKLVEQLEQLISIGVTDFYAGGAIGWDILCESTVIELRNRFPKIKLHLILPCPETEQIDKWSETDKIKYKQLILLADTIYVCSKHYHKECMKIRNKRLVELADVCVCYYNESDKRSGTGQTVRLAQKLNKPIINIKYL